MASINKLSDIIDNGLCIGCGLCQSIAGKDNIQISMSPIEYFYIAIILYNPNKL